MYLTVLHVTHSYHVLFAIKELSKKFMGQFECLGKTTDKCRSSSVPIEKEKKAYNKKSGKIIDKK